MPYVKERIWAAVFENRVLRRFWWAEMEEVTRGSRALHYKKIRDLYSLSNMYYCGDIMEVEMWHAWDRRETCPRCWL